jgi:hypothetical protein
MEKENESKKEDKAFVDGLVKEQAVTNALQKLHKKPFLVNVYRHTSLVEALETELFSIEEAMPKLDESEKVKAQARAEEAKAELIKLEADSIEGILSPLTYRDVNDIKAAITEAVVHFQEYKFNIDIVMARVAAEERYMTVFCVLKKKENPNRRYFDTLEDVAAIEEATIYSLYNRWEQHFVLTDTELKN